MRLRVVDHAEVRERQPRRLARGDEVDRALPRLDVDVGRRRRRAHVVRRRDAHAGDVADVGGPVGAVEVDDVVGGMTGRVLDVEVPSADR